MGEVHSIATWPFKVRQAFFTDAEAYDLSILTIEGNEQRARLTWHNGDGSTYICKFLPSEVFNQAADQGALSHLWGANYNNHYWGRFQRSAVH